LDALPVSLSEITGELWLQLALLFAVAFVLEEGTILAAALLAAAGELPAAAAAATVLAGLVVSDWCLYGIGHLAARVEWVRRQVDSAALQRGQRYLAGRLVLALLAARLIPWLLFPIFIGCGFVGVGFRRFALLNLAIATLYTALVFSAGLLFGQLAFDYLEGWGWLAAALLLLAVAVATYLLRRRHAGLPT